MGIALRCSLALPPRPPPPRIPTAPTTPAASATSCRPAPTASTTPPSSSQFTLTGDYPEHFGDQQPLYDGLIRGSLGLTNAELPNFFKDATFGVRAGQVESTVTPRPGVTITRDSAYGVPHIYGTTREDTMFGAGYANAADRLFLMDVLRHTGRAELSSFVGGSPSNRAMDRSQWLFAPYTDAELQAQFDAAPEMYGQEGVRLQNDVLAYVDGHQRLHPGRPRRPDRCCRPSTPRWASCPSPGTSPT